MKDTVTQGETMKDMLNSARARAVKAHTRSKHAARIRDRRSQRRGAAPAAADIGALPDAACNDGTRSAHQAVPHTNPGQGTNPGHKHLPRAPGGTCVHTMNP